MIVLIYLIIGFIVAAINNYLWVKLESPQEKLNDNPAMIIALVCWMILWPISLIGTIAMFRKYCRYKNNE